jgi:AraC-like DNA-binding protein
MIAISAQQHPAQTTPWWTPTATAHRTGHSSSGALRDRFTAALGTSPTAYRRAFRPRS